ncbi:4'-phosphopantetheinyl transferase superfamily protein [Streptomyces sp. NPDC016734]|uniref:4'-phosphopantetheinyl transferase family protein n=1 Tax=Streptomyces TaxID=1883 RepID=UPI00099C54B0
MAVREVHVWRASLSAMEKSESHRLCTPAEVSGAIRQKVTEAGQKFLLCRGTVRGILSSYADISPRRLVFEPGRFETRLRSDQAGSIRFDVSYSGDIMVCALSFGHRITVDVQAHDPKIDPMRNSLLTFTEAERRHLAMLQDDARRQLFFGYWTRKEALLKVQGLSISTSLGTRPAAGRPGEGPYLTSAGVVVHDVPVAAKFSGAVASPGHPWRPIARTWE